MGRIGRFWELTPEQLQAQRESLAKKNADIAKERQQSQQDARFRALLAVSPAVVGFAVLCGLTQMNKPAPEMDEMDEGESPVRVLPEQAWVCDAKGICSQVGRDALAAIVDEKEARQVQIDELEADLKALKAQKDALNAALTPLENVYSQVTLAPCDLSQPLVAKPGEEQVYQQTLEQMAPLFADLNVLKEKTQSLLTRLDEENRASRELNIFLTEHPPLVIGQEYPSYVPLGGAIETWTLGEATSSQNPLEMEQVKKEIQQLEEEIKILEKKGQDYCETVQGGYLDVNENPYFQQRYEFEKKLRELQVQLEKLQKGPSRKVFSYADTGTQCHADFIDMPFDSDLCRSPEAPQNCEELPPFVRYTFYDALLVYPSSPEEESDLSLPSL